MSPPAPLVVSGLLVAGLLVVGLSVVGLVPGAVVGLVPGAVVEGEVPESGGAVVAPPPEPPSPEVGAVVGLGAVVGDVVGT